MKCKKHNRKHPARWIKPLKETPKNVSKGCVHCGQLSLRLLMTFSMEWTDYFLQRDNKIVRFVPDGKVKMTMRKIEATARVHPYCNWTLFFLSGLYDITYQRQGKNNWVAIKKGKGYA